MGGYLWGALICTSLYSADEYVSYETSALKARFIFKLHVLLSPGRMLRSTNNIDGGVEKTGILLASIAPQG
jgi:hypothetical protein